MIGPDDFIHRYKEIMSGPGGFVERMDECRRQFGGTDDEYDKWCNNESCKVGAYRRNFELIYIYRKDQVFASRIHEMYREVVSAAIDGKGNFDELLAKLESLPTAMTASENELLEDYEDFKSFSVESKKTAALVASLFPKKAKKGRRINAVMLDLLHRIRMSSAPEQPLDADHPLSFLLSDVWSCPSQLDDDE